MTLPPERHPFVTRPSIEINLEINGEDA